MSDGKENTSLYLTWTRWIRCQAKSTLRTAWNGCDDTNCDVQTGLRKERRAAQDDVGVTHEWPSESEGNFLQHSSTTSKSGVIDASAN